MGKPVFQMILTMRLYVSFGSFWELESVPGRFTCLSSVERIFCPNPDFNAACASQVCGKAFLRWPEDWLCNMDPGSFSAPEPLVALHPVLLESSNLAINYFYSRTEVGKMDSSPPPSHFEQLKKKLDQLQPWQLESHTHAPACAHTHQHTNLSLLTSRRSVQKYR